MKGCPHKIKMECHTWMMAVTGLVAVALVVSLLLHVAGFTRWVDYQNYIIFVAVSVTVSWCAWTLKSLHEITTWWIDMRHKMELTRHNLHLARQDLDEIKKLAKQDP